MSRRWRQRQSCCSARGGDGGSRGAALLGGDGAPALYRLVLTRARVGVWGGDPAWPGAYPTTGPWRVGASCWRHRHRGPVARYQRPQPPPRPLAARCVAVGDEIMDESARVDQRFGAVAGCWWSSDCAAAPGTRCCRHLRRAADASDQCSTSSHPPPTPFIWNLCRGRGPNDPARLGRG